MSGCMPMACRCCECQGKMCLMWHPGHSCRVIEPVRGEWVNGKPTVSKTVTEGSNPSSPANCNCYPWDGIHAVDCPKGK